MRLANMVRVFFIIYCVEAGLLLVFAPWSPTWDRTVMQISWIALRNVCLHPLLRGAVSGFGLVHLVWGAHDLREMLTRRPPPLPFSPPPGAAEAPRVAEPSDASDPGV